MAILPLQPRLKSYRGAKENLRRKNNEYNAMARRVVDHVNTLIANDPRETQQYIYDYIAIDLGLSRDEVRDAIYGGGNNGITVGVTAQDRTALARYKK
jgi:hypothetical protein